MEKIKLQVSSSQIQVVQRPEAITAGMVGIEAEFAFDSHWDNLGKTVIFRAGDKVIAEALEGDTHIVPWEVLAKPDLWLVVGIYGANAEGTVVIPTLWTKVAPVYNGAEPEGDPALEPANPIWQQTLARVADMEPKLQEHIGNTDNPHGVNCDQIGAVTQKEFRDVVSNLDGSGDPEGLIPHLLNRDNPHGVTAEQVGAAPAGYGLGEQSSTSISLSGVYRNAFIRSNVDSPDGGWWYGLNIKYDQNIATQMAFKRVTDKGPLVMALRHRPEYGNANPWLPWEYVNPPMVAGVEYRTTERHNGKPVYVKYMDSAALKTPGSTNVTVTGESVDIIEIKGYLTRDNDSGYFPLPYFYGGNACAYIYAGYATEAGNTTVNITTTEAISTIVSGSTYTAHITVKYTKKQEA